MGPATPRTSGLNRTPRRANVTDLLDNVFFRAVAFSLFCATLQFVLDNL